MTWLLRIVGPYRHPHPWHSRAGGGAVHSIESGHHRKPSSCPLSANNRQPALDCPPRFPSSAWYPSAVGLSAIGAGDSANRPVLASHRDQELQIHTFPRVCPLDRVFPNASRVMHWLDRRYLQDKDKARMGFFLARASLAPHSSNRDAPLSCSIVR
jgi:hypothetical protein